MTALDRARLAKLLAMLGSAHDGEIVNAGRAAEKLRRATKLTWPEILSPAVPREKPEILDRHNIGQLLVENDQLYARIVKLERQLEAANARRRQQAQPPTSTVPENLDDLIRSLLVWEQHLNDWERGFVHDLIGRRRRQLSPKQCASLGDILSKIDFYRRHQGAA